MLRCQAIFVLYPLYQTLKQHIRPVIVFSITEPNASRLAFFFSAHERLFSMGKSQFAPEMSYF